MFGGNAGAAIGGAIGGGAGAAIDKTVILIRTAISSY